MNIKLIIFAPNFGGNHLGNLIGASQKLDNCLSIDELHKKYINDDGKKFGVHYNTLFFIRNDINKIKNNGIYIGHSSDITGIYDSNRKVYNKIRGEDWPTLQQFKSNTIAWQDLPQGLDPDISQEIYKESMLKLSKCNDNIVNGSEIDHIRSRLYWPLENMFENVLLINLNMKTIEKDQFGNFTIRGMEKNQSEQLYYTKDYISKILPTSNITEICVNDVFGPFCKLKTVLDTTDFYIDNRCKPLHDIWLKKIGKQ
jgi:hypothetical protein